jgi:heme/copper-type cytochrome/quinol oxidase subunit 3
MYLWNVNPDFDAAIRQPDGALALAALGGAALTGLAAWLAQRRARRGAMGLAGALALLTALLAVAVGAGLALSLTAVDPWESAVGATLWAVAAFVGVHLFVVAVWALTLAMRYALGRDRPGQALGALNLSTFTLGVAAMAAGLGAAFAFGALA